MYVLIYFLYNYVLYVEVVTKNEKFVCGACL